MKLLGLLGGMSWESTALYYRAINEGVRDRLGPLRSAELLMYSVDFGRVEACQREGRWDDAGELLADGARRLHRAGAQGLVLCTNTMHKVAHHIESAVPLPLLHISDPTGRAAQALGARTVGLLATGYTMREGFYRERLEQRFGLEVLVPNEPEREAVHRIIYEELCAGIVRDESRRTYAEVIASLCARGTQAIILGCTEITMLVGPQDSPVPTLDTTALHAQAAVEFALGGSTS
jgi:aspartate racemase